MKKQVKLVLIACQPEIPEVGMLLMFRDKLCMIDEIIPVDDSIIHYFAIFKFAEGERCIPSKYIYDGIDGIRLYMPYLIGGGDIKTDGLFYNGDDNSIRTAKNDWSEDHLPKGIKKVWATPEQLKLFRQTSEDVSKLTIIPGEIVDLTASHIQSILNNDGVCFLEMVVDLDNHKYPSIAAMIDNKKIISLR